MFYCVNFSFYIPVMYISIGVHNSIDFDTESFEGMVPYIFKGYGRNTFKYPSANDFLLKC